jgi:hypothetical protein
MYQIMMPNFLQLKEFSHAATNVVILKQRISWYMLALFDGQRRGTSRKTASLYMKYNVW